ncbi:MAG: 1-acyl-sn-glycerol-3-phosphate acyltransferase [Paucimonas sp.]|jgi:1-acyl-sn-glycerol-3-phosphate acyltransferase|nr:1-acyl-sn-glycerol-3-phosphate acyltransferase [Paucimonas sp.]
MNRILRALLAVYDCAVFYLGVFGFGALCLLWTVFAVPLHPLLPRNAGRKLGRFVIMAAFRGFFGFLQCFGRFHFDLKELDQLRHEKSLIIAPNHPSLWDALLIVSRLPDVACVMKAEIIGNVFLGAGARLARYIRNESVRTMIALAVDDLKRGNRVLLFPEGTRTVQKPVNRFKGSIGVIACRAQASVQTVFIETDSQFLTKGWPVYKKPRLPLSYRVRLGRRFECGGDSTALVGALEQYFVAEMSGSPAKEIRPAPVAERECPALVD